jgi:hypothetical protein
MLRVWRSGVSAALVGLLAVECQDAIRGEPRGDAGADADAESGGAAGADADADAGDALEVEAEAAPITFCDTVTPLPIFCEDFETPPFKAGWDNANRNPDLGAFGGGELTLDDIGYQSPHSAKMRTPPLVDPAVAAGAMLIRTFHNPTADLTFRMELRVDTEFFADGGTNLVPIMSLHFVDQGWFFLYRSTLGTAFSVDSDSTGPGAVNVLTHPFPVGEWKGIDVVVKNHPIDDSAPDGDVLVRVDVLDAGESPLPASFQQATAIQFGVGTVAKGVVGEFIMHADNVIVYDRSDL